MKVIVFYQARSRTSGAYWNFTASVMEQEQNAGDFQNLLSFTDKPAFFI